MVYDVLFQGGEFIFQYPKLEFFADDGNIPIKIGIAAFILSEKYPESLLSCASVEPSNYLNLFFDRINLFIQKYINLPNNMNPATQALPAACFTWGMTALGAGIVFMKRDISRRFLDCMLGFAGGVMIAASFWSLLAPAIEMSNLIHFPLWFPLRQDFLPEAYF